MWWLNLRASNTEPLLRLNVEAEDEDTMVRVRDSRARHRPRRLRRPPRGGGLQAGPGLRRFAVPVVALPVARRNAACSSRSASLAPTVSPRASRTAASTWWLKATLSGRSRSGELLDGGADVGLGASSVAATGGPARACGGPGRRGRRRARRWRGPGRSRPPRGPPPRARRRGSPRPAHRARTSTCGPRRPRRGPRGTRRRAASPARARRCGGGPWTARGWRGRTPRCAAIPARIPRARVNSPAASASSS